MDTIQFRKSSTSSIVVASVLLLLWMGGLLQSVSIFMDPVQGRSNPPQDIGFVLIGFYVLYVLAFLLPILIFGIKSVRNTQIKYVLTKEDIRVYERNALTVQIPKDRITAFGCYAVNRNGVLFFTTATEAEVSAIAKQDWDARNWIYTQEQLGELEQTEDGIWQIRLALYMQHEKDASKGNVLTMGFSAKQMTEISQFWNIAPLYIGSQAYAFRNAPF